MKTAPQITAAEAARRVRRREFVLPGIQRAFVWSPKQICDLFDSLLHEYPLGNLIVWRTRRQDHPHLPFRHFVTDYRGEHIPGRATLPKGQLLDAVLEGQQRLTPLAIGLSGSYQRTAASAPSCLYLDLSNVPEGDPGPEEPQYRFRFLTDREPERDEDENWFRITDALGLRSDHVKSALAQAGLPATRRNLKTLRHLVELINRTPVLPSLVETRPDRDRVLKVLSRVNKGGTDLTYVDLLVEEATSGWKDCDAAKELEQLRGELNYYGESLSGEGFQFGIDRIVEASLVLFDSMEPKYLMSAEAGRSWVRAVVDLSALVNGLRSPDFTRDQVDFCNSPETSLAPAPMARSGSTPPTPNGLRIGPQTVAWAMTFTDRRPSLKPRRPHFNEHGTLLGSGLKFASPLLKKRNGGHHQQGSRPTSSRCPYSPR